MARENLRESGRTLGPSEGHADLRTRRLGYTVRRTALTGLAVGALIAGVAGVSAALQGEADPGVTAERPGSRIDAVSPTGFAWRDGIRPGQVVTDLSHADDPDGWRLETTNGSTSFVSRAAPIQRALHDSLALGLFGLGAGSLAVLFVRTRREWILPAGSLAFLASSVPLWLSGYPEPSTFAMAGSAIVPGLWLAVRVPGGRAMHLVLGLGLVALVVAWAVTRLGGWDQYDQLEQARGAIALSCTGLLLLDRMVLPVFAGEPMHLTRPALIDVVMVGTLAGAAFAMVFVLLISPVLIGAVLVVAILALPPIRRRFGPSLRNSFLADVRAHAAAEGAEQERERLARELHDVPLQELVGVIRRLEVLPGAMSESEDLRGLAGHLRNIASDLRPPVLDDLGLPAALDYLAEETTSQALSVSAVVVDGTGFGPERRPPADVELAMFRIAREAVANSIKHAGASKVEIRAEVAPRRVEVVISDDGTGMDSRKVREAMRHKHLGLASMRRRAQAIDAELTIDGRGRGTAVTATWQA